jgi:hypothetical protein
VTRDYVLSAAILVIRESVFFLGWHAFRRGLGSNLNDLGVLDLTIQKILRHSNVTTTRKSYIHHREHQVTAAIGQLAAGIEAESRRAEAERLEAEKANGGNGQLTRVSEPISLIIH